MKKSPHVGAIRLALRDATTDNHRQVDALFADHAMDSPDSYRRFLTAHARALGALEPVARPSAPRLPLLASDIAALGQAMPAPLPLEDRASEGYRWGLLYALEGSRLGGAMLARKVAPDLPTAYLSAVHGKGEWIAFQHALDSAGAEGGEGWLDDAVQGAQAAFALFSQAGTAERATAHG
ncbi:biliverdin-producing heme oxygenase [Sphingobium sp. RAC03]|uniref:biliverdin-producing heme oxygenase n=1 Tax=Sphingobium sp. RAC03 TaxID=1843368 RepID=UPI00083DE614|nr:biliverdin-producing heme oxygenase [Sphingobium sp. RAC03]AOF97382.1 putative heme oxygenase [Sphingobium sp. RAC03]